ncbi:HNH endonuclease signature motif containing protein, partial [Sinomonas humi]
IVDARNVFSGDRWNSAGWEFAALGHQHARVIVDQARTLPPGDAAGFARRGLDRAVTRTGRRRTPAELRSALRRLREREHPESIGSRKEAAGRDRGVWFAPEPDGMCTLTAFLPAEAGLALYQGLDADARTARSHLTPTPGKPAGNPPGGGPGDAGGRGGGPAGAGDAGDAGGGCGPGDAVGGGAGAAGSWASVAAAEERTLSQLRADALVHRLLGVPDEAFPGPFRPHITLTIPVRTLLPPHSSHAGGPAPDDATGCDALGGDLTEGDAPQGPQGPAGPEGPAGSGSVGSGPAELEGYGPIDAATARRLAALAPNWDRLFTDWDTGAALGVGRTAYRPPQALRRYLAHRDGGCRFPGCTRPAHACEPDHTTEWQDGGTTDPHNLASR